jgi:hypothetical protein
MALSGAIRQENISNKPDRVLHLHHLAHQQVPVTQAATPILESVEAM